MKILKSMEILTKEELIYIKGGNGGKKKKKKTTYTVDNDEDGLGD